MKEWLKDTIKYIVEGGNDWRIRKEDEEEDEEEELDMQKSNVPPDTKLLPRQLKKYFFCV